MNAISPLLSNAMPAHIAIVMDGNGRWATARGLPRIAGHRRGVVSVRSTIEYCARHQVKVLTLFAFSSENWRRPKKEVYGLLSLFFATLEKEINTLHENNIRMQFIGDRTPFKAKLIAAMEKAEALTKSNTGLILNVALNYGGRWDLVSAFRQIATKIKKNEIALNDINEDLVSSYLSLAGLPEPDLFIRTSGEQRLSNFLLWDLAYTECYFPPVLWPDFDEPALEKAIQFYQSRQRRFGHTTEQLLEDRCA